MVLTTSTSPIKAGNAFMLSISNSISPICVEFTFSPFFPFTITSSKSWVFAPSSIFKFTSSSKEMVRTSAGYKADLNSTS